MIKPSDVKLTRQPNQNHINVLEEHADKAIESAHINGGWPVSVRTMRMPIDPMAVDAAVDRYRAAGWIVGSAPGCYFTIDNPERKS